MTGWSLRDLAKDLDIAPSVIYHHIGGKVILTRHIVDRVLATIDFPTEMMPWRDWFRSALYPARPVLAGYPGVAKWLIMNGPLFPRLVPVVDSGIASLQRAGFGADAAVAYSAVFNTAMLTISLGDERLHPTDGGRQDYDVLAGEYAQAAASSPGLTVIAQDMLSQFTGSTEEVSAANDRYYRYVLERLMDGLERSIEVRNSLPR